MENSKSVFQQLRDSVGEVSRTTQALLTALMACITFFGVQVSSGMKVAIVVAIAVAIVVAFVCLSVSQSYRKRRLAALAAFGAFPTTGDSGAALRFLHPFGVGDTLLGRNSELQDLHVLVTSLNFRYGVLYGDSGSGKTSLLRAGLLEDVQEREGLTTIYLPNSGKDPARAICEAVSENVHAGLPDAGGNPLHSRLVALASGQDRTFLIICDQFEEFLIANRSERARKTFFEQIGECVQDSTLPIAFLFSMRGDFFGDMRGFSPGVPEPMSISVTQQLDNFHADIARKVLYVAARNDGVALEATLVDAVIDDLAADTMVRPAELQIVGTLLKRERIFTLEAYNARGRAATLLGSYITRAIESTGDPDTARLILQLFCAADSDVRRPDSLSLSDIVTATQATPAQSVKAHRAHVQAILAYFVRERIVLEIEQDTYNLVHDYLVQSIRKALTPEQTETKAQRANRLLDQYIALYREAPWERIPWRKLREIERYASATRKEPRFVQELLGRSKRAWLFHLAEAALARGVQKQRLHQLYRSVEHQVVAFRVPANVHENGRTTDPCDAGSADVSSFLPGVQPGWVAISIR
ncbi:MAG: ATP-binding protein [Thermomicrobia bacterium]|nr:ATP-binding protein [Thermomicrobia bacterium]